MEAKEVGGDALALLKLLIIGEQEQIAKLGRSGQKAKARRARERLYRLLDRKDELERRRSIRKR